MTRVMVGLHGQFHVDLTVDPNFDVMDAISSPTSRDVDPRVRG